MKLVEVIKILETSDDTFDSLMAWSKAIGKHPVTCRDTEGFIVNRLLGPYIGVSFFILYFYQNLSPEDAIAMVERGDATYKDVDTAVKLGLGYPMGPFELLDYTGIDLHKHINDNPDFPIRRPSKLIDKMVAVIGRWLAERWTFGAIAHMQPGGRCRLLGCRNKKQ